MNLEMHGSRWFSLVCVCLCLVSFETNAAETPRLGDLREVLQAHFNHDASRVIVRTRNEEFGIWDTKKGTPISGGDASLKKPSQGYVMSADGRKVLVGFKDGRARIFDPASVEAISPALNLLLRESDNPQAVFSPDGGTLVFFGEKNASVLEAKTGRKITTMPVPFEVEEGSGSTASAIFTKDGAKCFVSDSGAHVTAYETKKWTALGKAMDHPPAEMAYQFGFEVSHDGKWVVTFDDPGENGPQGHLQVWDASTSKALGEPLSAQNGMAGRFLPGQERVLVQSGRGDASVRDLPAMAVAYEIKKHDEIDGPKVDIFPNGKWLLAWGHDKRIDLVDAVTGKVLSSYSSPVPIRRVTIPADSSACYLGVENSPMSSDHQYDNAVQRLSVPDLKVSGSLSIPDYLIREILSPDGRWLMILQGEDDEEKIAIFDAATMKPVEWPRE